MSRSGFSLVELIIATTLASLVIIAFYSVIDQSRGVQSSVNRALAKERDSAIFYRVLSQDIIQSQSLEYKEGVMVLVTPNTLHHRFDGNVTYLYDAKHKELLRAESKLAHDITQDFNDEMLENISVDRLLSDVDAFEVTTDKKKQSVIVYIKHKGEELAYGFKRLVIPSEEESSSSSEASTIGASTTEATSLQSKTTESTTK
jgi:prepilin-type N-terminal cleavage/methylation domain-containing protein